MTKLEKVLKGLELLKQRLILQADVLGYGEHISDIDNALELLKEQEPKPVLSPHIDRFCIRGFAEYIAYCPNCKQEILEKYNKSYCGFCGKAVKWDADISR